MNWKIVLEFGYFGIPFLVQEPNTRNGYTREIVEFPVQKFLKGFGKEVPKWVRFWFQNCKILRSGKSLKNKITKLNN